MRCQPGPFARFGRLRPIAPESNGPSAGGAARQVNQYAQPADASSVADAKPRDGRVWSITAVLALATAGLWLTGWPATPARMEPHLSVLLLLLLVAAAELVVVHLPFGREAQTVSFAEVPLVLGLFFAPAWQVGLAYVVGTNVAQLATVRRPTVVKSAFNVAASSLFVTNVLLVFGFVLGSADPLSPRGWLAAMTAVGVADLVTFLAVQGVIWSRQETQTRAMLREALTTGLVLVLGSTQLGLVAAILYARDPRAVVLLASMLGLVVLFQRGYLVLRQRHARLEVLLDFTSAVDRALHHEGAEHAVVSHARRLMRADDAAIVAADDTPDDAWWRPALAGQSVRLPRTRRGHPAPSLSGTGYRDALAVPLRGDHEITGVLLVADRLDEVSTFDEDDTKLLEALAGHAAVTLANSALMERVRADAAERERAARHDRLTGLLNRHGFVEVLDGRLAAGGTTGLLMMDLDRFKEVNDTLGHPVGDAVLGEVARRLQEAAESDEVLGRLGGDEFAFLVPGPDVARRLEQVAGRVMAELAAPTRVGALELEVTASAGAVTAPDDGTVADVLLRHAEVAMYEAKGGPVPVVRYEAAHDPYSPRRLSLMADLGRAIDEGTLSVHFQPQVRIPDGRPVAVEALLRWTHPVWGPISPSEFMAAAEHTRLVRPISRFVLDTALHQCADWRAAEAVLAVSVNLSARNLAEPDLPDDVASLLDMYGLPSDALVVEITESAIAEDPARATATLERLAALGVTVSVDDFGIGYSSLGRLTVLPVGEVKIDRSFVMSAVASAENAVIVRSVVDLGHDLGLRVVAEGVEDERSAQMLADLGCDLAQGFYYAPPMPAAAVTSWLAERQAGHLTAGGRPPPPRVSSQRTGREPEHA